MVRERYYEQVSGLRSCSKRLVKLDCYLLVVTERF